MSTQDFIIELFCRVDDVMQAVPKHSQANLHPSETVPLVLLFAINGVGNRAYYRWLRRDYVPLFPLLPERTRLFRLFSARRDWADHFLADPTVMGIAEPYGRGAGAPDPRRPERGADRQEGQEQLPLDRRRQAAFRAQLNGQVVDWEVATANVRDATFHPLIEQLVDQSLVLTESGFHSRGGDPSIMSLCRRGHRTCG